MTQMLFFNFPWYHNAIQSNKINIHLGGAYGDKKSAMDRFCQNFKLLSQSVRSRLTVENDDKESMYSTKELYNGIYNRIGVPIVFDYHHHKFCDLSSCEIHLLKLSTLWLNDCRLSVRPLRLVWLQECTDTLVHLSEDYVLDECDEK